MTQAIEFYSHRVGPNPWKSVLVLEELGVDYKTEYLDFGSDKNGVEHPKFLQKNPAGRVPLLWDPKSDVTLTESSVINEYLVDNYDKHGLFAAQSAEERYQIRKWTGFQASTQAPFYAQSLQLQQKNNAAAVEHFQALVKRTLKTVDTELQGKKFLVGDRYTLADAAFLPWDLLLDVVLSGDSEAATPEQREKLYPNWYKWHAAMLKRPAVQKMLALQKDANK